MAPLLEIEADFDTLVWRFEQLRRAGYAEHAASELAGRADIDLHAAADLLRHGCSQRTALAILR